MKQLAQERSLPRRTAAVNAAAAAEHTRRRMAPGASEPGASVAPPPPLPRARTDTTCAELSRFTDQSPRRCQQSWEMVYLFLLRRFLYEKNVHPRFAARMRNPEPIKPQAAPQEKPCQALVCVHATAQAVWPAREAQSVTTCRRVPPPERRSYSASTARRCSFSRRSAAFSSAMTPAARSSSLARLLATHCNKRREGAAK